MIAIFIAILLLGILSGGRTTTSIVNKGFDSLLGLALSILVLGGLAAGIVWLTLTEVSLFTVSIAFLIFGTLTLLGFIFYTVFIQPSNTNSPN